MPRYFNPEHNDRPDVQENAFGKRGGMFFPSDHTVIAITNGDDADALCDRLCDEGLAPLLESPDRMRAFLEPTFIDAGAAAHAVSSELKQTEILYQLAQSGCWFIIVPIEDPSVCSCVVSNGKGFPIVKALCYHQMVIEELKVGSEVVPGMSPYGSNEVPRAKASDAQVVGATPRKGR